MLALQTREGLVIGIAGSISYGGERSVRPWLGHEGAGGIKAGESSCRGRRHTEATDSASKEGIQEVSAFLSIPPPQGKPGKDD